jgi:Domain of unknown function (DUF4328)
MLYSQPESIPPPPPSEPPRAEYIPLGGRQTAVFTVFALIMVLDAFAVISSLMELDLLNSAAAGEAITPAQADANDARQGVVGLAQTGAYLACAVVFIRWFHGAYKNLDAVAPGARERGTGWAIGGWFVPILNLWRPKEIVNEIWRGSGPREDRDARPPAFLMVWWLAYLVSGWLGQAAFRTALKGDTLDEMRTADYVYIASDGFDVIAAGLALLVVSRVTARMDAAYAARTGSLDAPDRALGSPAGAVSQ